MPIAEEWRSIKGWEGFYEVSNQGRVRSLDRIVTHKASSYRGEQQHRKHGRVLTPTPDDFGYPMVQLYMHGERRAARVHTLVAEEFIGPCPDGHEVAHNDGNPTNGWATNLRYATRMDNLGDKVKHGTRTGGEKHSRAKLTQQQVDRIKEMRATGLKYREIAPHFGVHPMHIGQICRGGRWNP